MGKEKSCRLPYDQDAMFSGQLINRGRPLRFTLNGRVVNGFEGDTILSALLSSGIDTVGEIFDEPISLDPSLCPPIVIETKYSKETIVLPMDRTPAINGLKLSTIKTDNNTDSKKTSPVSKKLGLKSIAQSLWKKPNRSLDFDFSEGNALPGPWTGQAVDETQKFDLIVVGGGIAGLSAARTAMENGQRVALLELQTVLGGDARLFGAIEGEPRPDDFVNGIVATLRASDLVDIFTNTEAITLNAHSIRAHQVLVTNQNITSRVIEFTTTNIILATGTLERLPLFPGNRLPGVVTSRTAFRLASNYGIWQGETAAFCTASSAATQVALLGADMGIKIAKLADNRANPKSRFFEFAKAYGVSLATGTQVVHVSAQKNKNISVQFGLTQDALQLIGDELFVDRLIVCGGWQPNLTLWHSAGGQTNWSSQTQHLLATGKLDHISLAGACAGAMSMSDCLASGQAATLDLLEIEQTDLLSPFTFNKHESEDGQLPVATQIAQDTNCYLDNGHTLSRPLPDTKQSFWQKILPNLKTTNAIIEEISGEHSLNDVVAKVILGEIPQGFAGIFAQERCGVGGEMVANKPAVDLSISDNIALENFPPSYLQGRFGRNARVVALLNEGEIVLETGCLIYLDNEKRPPSEAIGAIVCAKSTSRSNALAYIDGKKLGDLTQVIVQNGTHNIITTVKNI